MIIEIGGGSTQIIEFSNNEIINYLNIDIGSIIATEKYIASNKISELKEFIKSIIIENPWISKSNAQIIGVGGIIRTISRIDMKTDNYPLNLIHNYNMNINSINTLTNKLSSSNFIRKNDFHTLLKDRGDILEGGLVILKTILDATSTKNILVSNCGRREGILYEYLSNHKKISLSNTLDNTITNIMDTFYINTNHANHVSYLSNLLFNQLKSLHNYGPQENKILYIASLLHDIGKNIGYDDNHLHTFYIIKNTNLYSLSHREIIITAAVAASHKKIPCPLIGTLNTKR